jgi:Membrane domain of glycerophosphoryl diester phosphodiesterase
VDLRPLTLAELLDRSFSTYKQHLWLFVGIMAVPAIWAMVSGIGLQLFQGAAGRGVEAEEVLWRSVVLIVWSMTFGLTYLLAYAFALGATTFVVSQLYMQRVTTVRAAYQAVRRHGGRLVLLLFWGWFRLFLTLMGFAIVAAIFSGLVGKASPILSFVVIMLGLGAGVVLSLYMVVRWGVAVPAVVLEDLSARGSLKRSIELTEDNRGRVCLVILCAVVVTYATALVLQVPFMVGSAMAGPGTPMSVALGIAGAVLGGIGGMFSGPIMIIGLAMMYYDLRIRKETLDLHLMLDTLDGPPRS